MKRVAYPAPVIAARSAPAGVGAEQAAALLTRAMQESQTPVTQIGDAIERMMHALHDGLPADELRRVFARDLALCVHGLQFHDRLVQQVSCVRDLISVAGATPSAPAHFPQGEPAEGSVELF